MSVQVWQEQNNVYLAAAIAWVRALLALASARAQSAAGPESEEMSPARVELARALLALREAERMEPPPAALSLARRLRLSEFELAALLLCAAFELDSRTVELCEACAGARVRGPSFGLMLAVLPSPAWDAISPDGPLRHHQLISGAAEQGSLLGSPLWLDEAILHFIKGLPVRDPRLASLVAAGPRPERELAPSQRRVVDALVEAMERERSHAPMIVLYGPDPDSACAVAASACERVGLLLESLRIDALGAPAAELSLWRRLLQRHAALFGGAVLLDSSAADDAQQRFATAFAAELDVPVLVVAAAPIQSRPRPGASFEVRRPDAEEQRHVWADAIGSSAPDIPISLSANFNFDVTTIRRIAANASATADARALGSSVWAACRASARREFGALGHVERPRTSLSELVLADAELALVSRLVEHARQRGRVEAQWGFDADQKGGRGSVALFGGASGTGKSMAARAVATELELDLVNVDVSSLVSKYIGETARNLRRVFDAADAGGVVLFFDEADALFGRRTLVARSDDRYANMDVGYLLQRIEKHVGVVILATNALSAIDPAFLRRMRFLVQFTTPDAARRLRIWQGVFPEATPREPLDWQELSRFELTGGCIRNAAVNAAFAAAAEGSAVGMRHVRGALLDELRKARAGADGPRLGAPNAGAPLRVAW